MNTTFAFVVALSILTLSCSGPRQYEGPIRVDSLGFAGRMQMMCRVGKADEATGRVCDNLIEEAALQEQETSR